MRERSAAVSGSVSEKTIDNSDNHNRKKDLHEHTRDWVNNIWIFILQHIFFGTQASPHHRLFRINNNNSSRMVGCHVDLLGLLVREFGSRRPNDIVEKMQCALQTKGTTVEFGWWCIWKEFLWMRNANIKSFRVEYISFILLLEFICCCCCCCLPAKVRCKSWGWAHFVRTKQFYLENWWMSTSNKCAHSYAWLPTTISTTN